MNINYADIITKANTRKQGLEALEVKLEDVEEYSRQLLEALSYFIELKNIVTRIDDEGRKLILPIVTRITGIGYTCGLAHDTLFKAASGNDERVLKALVAAVEAA